MNAYQKYLNELFNRNKKLYDSRSGIRWLNPYQSGHFQDMRDHLLRASGGLSFFKGTKPYYRDISEGCRLCGQGRWSCLFITGKCNASCFYCPSPQAGDEVPSTQGLSFPTAVAYAEYVFRFGFRAAAFSGGEPLLFPDRVLNYLREVKKGPQPCYTWLYTNGIVASRELFLRLAEAGLDEVRFDIGATGYSLERIALARKAIRNITVEIPAIPEHREKLARLLPRMEEAGVKYLNLHQLRLTPHNAGHLLKRDYTYYPAEKPVVVESELAALDILNSAKEQGLSIGVNYCSFAFKNRFQQAGFRKRLAENLLQDDIPVTEQGYLRAGRGAEIAYEAFRIADAGKLPDPSSTLSLRYKSFDVEKYRSFAWSPAGDAEKDSYTRLLRTDPGIPPGDDKLFRIWQHEYIESGLREY